MRLEQVTFSAIILIMLMVCGCSGEDAITEMEGMIEQVKSAHLFASQHKIVFASDRDGNTEIYVMNIDGTNPINLTNHPDGDSHPIWSPDRQEITFTTERDGNTEVYVMNANGTNQTNLTNRSTGDRLPA